MFPFEKARGIRASRSLTATVMAGFLLAAVLAAASTDGSAPKLTIENTQLCHVKLKWTFTQPSDWYSCSIDSRETNEDGEWEDWVGLKKVKPAGAAYVQCAGSDEMGFRAKQGQKYQIRATGYNGSNQWRASPDSNEVVADLNIGCP